MIVNILLFIFWFYVWLLLSWPPGRQDMLIGAAVSAFVTLMTADLLIGRSRCFRNPLRYLWFIQYVLVFAWECLKANIDVAFRVIHPDLPIRPGTIRVRTVLKSDIALTFLANSITLTPGTTTIDIDKHKGYVYVHCLCVDKMYDRGIAKLAVMEKFENILKKIFE